MYEKKLMCPEVKGRKLNIFCLETEWTHEDEKLKDDSLARHLLEFMKSNFIIGAEYCFRQVATYWDFKFYLEHLKKEPYKNINFIYLCFHGEPGKIYFPDGKSTSLTGIGRDFKDIFKYKYVHFDSCRTLYKRAEDIFHFKNETGARLVTGYINSVPFTESFLFEIWLFKTISDHPSISSDEIRKLAKEQMGYLAEKLGFVAY